MHKPNDKNNVDITEKEFVEEENKNPDDFESDHTNNSVKNVVKPKKR